jgi:hypothetical protein
MAHDFAMCPYSVHFFTKHLTLEFCSSLRVDAGGAPMDLPTTLAALFGLVLVTLVGRTHSISHNISKTQLEITYRFWTTANLGRYCSFFGLRERGGKVMEGLVSTWGGSYIYIYTHTKYLTLEFCYVSIFDTLFYKISNSRMMAHDYKVMAHDFAMCPYSTHLFTKYLTLEFLLKLTRQLWWWSDGPAYYSSSTVWASACRIAGADTWHFSQHI